MEKIIIDKESYLGYYNKGLSDVAIGKLLGISNDVLSRFRKSLGLKAYTSGATPTRKRQYKSIVINDSMHQLMLGTILGDGHLSRTGKSKNYRLAFGHSIKQLEYLKCKVDILNGLFNAKILTRNTPTGVVCNIKSISHPLITSYAEYFYCDKTKIISTKILEQLTTEGLAYLFMDDGSYDNNTNSLYISLCNFTTLENKLFCNWLKEKYDINTSLHNKGKIDQKYIHIYIKADSRLKFVKLIKPYIIDSMKYKLGKYGEAS